MTLPLDTAVQPAGVSALQPGPRDAGSRPQVLDVSVVICAYTQDRWDQIRAAVESVTGQSARPAQVLLVIDHNPQLADRARRDLRGVTVLDSTGLPGLSGARNTGLQASRSSVTAFLDDDAAARPGWLASLVEPYRRADVVATGGSVQPRWLADQPRWLPEEFYWVIGCSYRGLPETNESIRNPIGANMSVRTAQALAVGGFDSAVGLAAGRPLFCEETEFAIRLSARVPGTTIMYVPAAAVDHNVGPARTTFRYFVRRCWREGRSKAAVVRLAGASAGLQRERRHVGSVIPSALSADLRRLARGEAVAAPRMGAMLAGVGAAAAGYLAGSAWLRIARDEKPSKGEARDPG